MKIVLAQHPECDFLGHAISTGLYENSHEILEIPYVKSLHGQVDDWYLLADGKRGMSAPPGYLQINPLPDNERSEEEVLDIVGEADLIISHSTRRYALAALDKIINRLGRNPGNIVIADGDDTDYIDRGIIERFRPIVFFKREMLQHYPLAAYSVSYGCPIFPLPFASFTRGFPEVDDQDKNMDFFLSLGNTNPLRNKLLGKCLEARIDKIYIATDGNNPIRGQHPFGHEIQQMLPWPEYIKAQSQAKIGASCAGFGRDTLNFWEKMSFETLCLWCDPGIVIPYPPIPNQHVVEFTEDCEDVPRLIKYYLDPIHEGERKAIAKAGKSWLYAHHTTQQRATWLLDISRKIMGGEKVEPEEFGL